MPTPYEKRERELAEIDQYDVLSPDIAISYQKRLQDFSNYLDVTMTYTTPEDKAVRRRLLNEADVRQGPTNFSANPYDYTLKGTQLRGREWNTETIPPQYRKADAAVNWSNPYVVHINPNKEYEQKDYPSSALLGHELIHGKQGVAWRRGQSDLTNPAYTVNAVFPSGFVDDLNRLKKTKYNDPRYSGFGSASDPSEMMGYLLGREASLPKGKTLKDDPIFKPLFERNPGAWEEYQKTKQKLRNIK